MYNECKMIYNFFLKKKREGKIETQTSFAIDMHFVFALRCFNTKTTFKTNE